MPLLGFTSTLSVWGWGRHIWDMSIVNIMASTRSQFQLREAGDTVQSDNAFVTWVVGVNL